MSLQFLNYDNSLKYFDIILVVPSCTAPSSTPTSVWSLHPSSIPSGMSSLLPSLIVSDKPSSRPSLLRASPMPSNLPTYVKSNVPSSAPTLNIECKASELIGKTYYVPFIYISIPSCIKVELFENGFLSLDVNNADCNIESFEDSNTVSVFNRTIGNNFYFSEGVSQMSYYEGILISMEDPDTENITLEVTRINTKSRTFEGIISFPSCSAPSTSPVIISTSSPSYVPTENPSNKPSSIPSIFLSSIPTPNPPCLAENLVGATYYVPTNIGILNVCYKVELFDDGIFSVDTNNPDCVNDSFDDYEILSLFNNTKGNVVFYTEQLPQVELSGTFTVEEDTSIEGASIEILQFNRGIKQFEAILSVSSCAKLYFSPSTIPSSQPSLVPTTLPSSAPSFQPIPNPSIIPSSQPSLIHSLMPSVNRSNSPSTLPSIVPSKRSSSKPSSVPTTFPSSAPSLSRCPITSALGQTYYLKVLSACWKLELFTGGSLQVAYGLEVCSESGFSSNPWNAATFDGINEVGNEALFRYGLGIYTFYFVQALGLIQRF